MNQKDKTILIIIIALSLIFIPLLIILGEYKRLIVSLLSLFITKYVVLTKLLDGESEFNKFFKATTNIIITIIATNKAKQKNKRYESYSKHILMLRLL